MKDYHVHYYIDTCSNEAMTFENIDKKCKELGITEAAVLKHYSHWFPNEQDAWIFWNQIKEEEWNTYLREFSEFKPKYTLFRSGVETELLNQRGDINIPVSEQEKIDIVQLSVHFMMDMDCLPMDLLIYPNFKICPRFDNPEGRALLEKWEEKVEAAGTENIISGHVQGYMNAINRFSKVKSLAHFDDGMAPLRTYHVDVNKVSQERVLEIFEPLMKLMAEKGVAWELAGPTTNLAMLKRAHELGVFFTATADAHFLEGGWGPLTRHIDARNFILENSLRLGEIEF